MTTKSGYLNNPPKVIIVSDDNRPGSYPSNASPIDIRRSQGSDSLRPYRDDILPTARSPYATARIRFLTDAPLPSSTITLTSTSGKVSVFTFRRNLTTSSTYDINMSDLPRGGTTTTTDSIRIADEISKRFVSAVMRSPECEIVAECGNTLGEVILMQGIPGSAGSTSISTTVSASRLRVENFTGGNSEQVRYPYGHVISDSDPKTSEVIRRVIKSERSGSLSAPGSPDPQKLIGPSDQHFYVNYTPYDETNAQQSFGVTGGSDVYGTQVQMYDDFFTRGSTLGSLDEPLSTKDKIEIDLTPVIETTIRYQDISGQNYPMCYYNFNEKKWDKIGKGEDPSSNGTVSLDLELDSYYIGFGQGYGNETYASSLSNMEIYDNELLSKFTGEKNIFRSTGWNTCIDTFGFPVHPKYHATSSQQLDVSSLVDRPFIVEKFIYEFSGSSPGFSSTFPGIYYGLGGTFFILNQRVSNPDPGQEGSYTSTYIAFNDPRDPGFAYSPPLSGSNFSTYLYNNGGIPRKIDLTGGGSQTYVNTTRDIVSYARVGTITSDYQSNILDTLEEGFPHPAEFMDLAVELPPGGSLDGIYTISSNIKAPSSNPATSLFTFNDGSSANRRYYLAKDSCTRNSLDIPTGRSYNYEFLGPNIVYKCVPDDADDPQIQCIYGIKKDSESSPYIIRPGDKLVFGWQSLLPSRSFDNGAPPLELGPGAGKLVLYGSYLRDDKPVHNIYKDQLISDSVHEAIPAGPAVLDMFDTEPTMIFSGSMREEFVTGTMFTRTSSGISVTNPNDITSVRMVVGRASEGNLGKRASFSRNLRLSTAGEQFYDSMQPNPLDVLMDYGGANGKVYSTANGGFCLISVPGEIYYNPLNIPFANQMNLMSNKNFLGSFPFETKYSSISRVRSINSRVINSKKINSIGFELQENIRGVAFITGSFAGDGSRSNLTKWGGIMKNPSISVVNAGGFLTLMTSINDTNPIKGFSRYLAEKQVDIDGINYHFSRFMGCFGDGYLGIVQFLHYDTSNPDLLSEMIYRGCKYGLINPTPLSPAAIFNGSHYGQFRDMLEQRPYTVFSDPSTGLSPSPVQVRFINRETGAPLPAGLYSGTNSINLSAACTSSLPYFDGQVRDRDLPMPEQSIYYEPTFPSFLFTP